MEGDDPLLRRERWTEPERAWLGLYVPYRLVLWAYARLRVAGLEHVPRKGAVLLVSNHVSAFDPLTLIRVGMWARRRTRFLASRWLFSHALAGWFLRSTRHIPVDQAGGPTRMVEAAMRPLSVGECVVVYPEGGIPKAGEERRPRPGAGLLALSCPGPVLPVRIRGIEQLHGPHVPRRRDARVTIGPPFDLSAWEGRRDRRAQLEVSKALMDTVMALPDVDAEPVTAPD